MLLITEQNEAVIAESSGATTRGYFIEGIFLQAEVENRNGRKYPKSVLDREVEEYNRVYVSKKRAFGECDHPTTTNIALDRVSHIITELYPDGNNYIGKAKILDTPTGKILKAFIDEGAQLGVSSRGVGSLKEDANGVQIVQPDYHLCTIDVVSDPSAPSAFVNGIMEGKEWVFENGVLTEMTAGRIQKAVKTLPKAAREEFIMREFKKFMSTL